MNKKALSILMRARMKPNDRTNLSLSYSSNKRDESNAAAEFPPKRIAFDAFMCQMVERINWKADRSDKGLSQSGGIMVNYVYRLDHIEEYAHSYFSNAEIHASSDLHHWVDVTDTA